MGTALIGGVTMATAAFDAFAQQQMHALGGTRSAQNFRGPSGDHMLLRMVGDRPWLLGPDAKRFSQHLALALAREVAGPVTHYWLEVEQQEVLVTSSYVTPAGGIQELELELPEEVTSTYQDDDLPYRPPNDMVTIKVARALVHGLGRLQDKPGRDWATMWNWGGEPGEEILGVFRLPRSLPSWPHQPRPPSPPPALPAPPVLRRRKVT
jgi:hypothetical protein